MADNSTNDYSISLPTCGICKFALLPTQTLVRTSSCSHVLHERCRKEIIYDFGPEFRIPTPCMVPMCTGQLDDRTIYPVTFTVQRFPLLIDESEYLENMIDLERQLSELHVEHTNIRRERSQLMIELHEANHRNLLTERREANTINELRLQIEQLSIEAPRTQRNENRPCDNRNVLAECHHFLPRTLRNVMEVIRELDLHICTKIPQTLMDSNSFERDHDYAYVTRYLANSPSGSTTTYFLNSVMCMGDGLVHDLVDLAITNNQERRKRWRTNSLSRAGITRKTLIDNIDKYLIRIPRSILISFGEAQIDDAARKHETYDDIKAIIKHLIYRGVNQIFLAPIPNRRVGSINHRARNCYRAFLQNQADGVIVHYLQGLEEIIDEQIPDYVIGSQSLVLSPETHLQIALFLIERFVAHTD
ncbi:uncharacterized protein LOC135843388 [Planococcus citri]|uniref:uncharacterized protein LOC135843388 n=1 Tax=Planococcus citri TaxID=170843 RepID=UPI0031F8407A